MAQVANVAEDYSSRTYNGAAALLSRIALTGWGAVTTAVPSLETWTDRGRLWWVFTVSSGDLSFYRRATLGSGDKVCSGTVSSGLVTLSAANTSGVTGTCECSNGTLGTTPTVDASGDMIVSYAHENDLIDRYAGVVSYLDSNSKFEAQNTRFEAILRDSKRELDEHIAGAIGSRLRFDSSGRRMLADIADPRQLAPVHAMYAIGMLEMRRAGLDMRRHEVGSHWQSKARELLRGTLIAMDYEADAKQDVEANVSSARLILS